MCVCVCIRAHEGWWVQESCGVGEALHSLRACLQPVHLFDGLYDLGHHGQLWEIWSGNLIIDGSSIPRGLRKSAALTRKRSHPALNSPCTDARIKTVEDGVQPTMYRNGTGLILEIDLKKAFTREYRMYECLIYVAMET